MSATKPFDNKFSPQLRYEQTTALYASQFVITANSEEVIISFSSGLLPGTTTGETVLPIHTRIALSANSARKLASLINQALTASQNAQLLQSFKAPKLHS
jgi:hypothetical protein